MSGDNSRSNNYGSHSIASFDSTGKKKSFRRTLTRFADKTSMAGVTYINNAKFWWAKVIWCIMLVVAMVAMGLHLWYLFDQFYSWPVQTRISLGFDSLPFPEITICNTNVIHQRRLNRFDGAQNLKDLLDALKPENLAPNQYDENYNFDDVTTTTATPPQNTMTTKAQSNNPPSSQPPASGTPITGQNPPLKVSNHSFICTKHKFKIFNTQGWSFS